MLTYAEAAPLVLVRASPTQSHTPWHIRGSWTEDVEHTRCDTGIATDHSEILGIEGLLTPSGPRMAPICVYCLQTLRSV